MGQCYSVVAVLRPKDRAADVVKEFAAFVREKEGAREARFVHPRHGFRSVTYVAGCLLASHQRNFDKMSKWMFSSGFDASYGWEVVLQDAFARIAPFLHEDSYIEMAVDEGRWKLTQGAALAINNK